MDRKIRLRIVFIVGVFCIWGFAPPFPWAAPSILAVSGTVANGQTVTLAGSGFGANGPNIVLFDDFEKGTNGETVNIGPGSAQVGKWDGRGSNSAGIKYSNSYAHSGYLALKNDWSTGINNYLELNSFGRVTNIYISFWSYVPVGKDLPGYNNVDHVNWKVIWLGDSTTAWPWGSDQWYCYVLNNLPGDVIYGQADDTGSPSRIYDWCSPTMINGQWSRLELYFVNSTSSGVIRGWETNSTHSRYQLLSSTGVTAHSNELWDIIHLPGYGRKDSNSHTYHDDIYIAVGAGALARVEIGNNANYSKCTNLAVFTPISWNDTSVTATVRQGSFYSGSSAYLFVVDSNGAVNSQGYPIVIGGGSADAPPSINITSPTSESTYLASQNTVQIGGSSADANGVTNVTWSNSRGGSGTAVNNSGNWASWSTGNISLQEGENIITVTASDTKGQTGVDTLTVTYSPSAPVQAWSANVQTGDSSWTNSSVTYCVRLLIEGSKVTQSGNMIQLGFQGRTSGTYTIKKVSIAERDTAGLVGDVIDSTWTRVTFDGKTVSTWASDIVSVPAGQEKLSNAIGFPLKAGKDYYITFKIESPSVYLDPPSTYRELYFYNADHTEDIDWGQNGHDSTQDYHALSRIYVIAGSSGGGFPSPPTNLKLN